MKAITLNGPYRLEKHSGGAAYYLCREDIPQGRLSLRIAAPQGPTEELVLDRILMLLNAYDGTPGGEIPAVVRARAEP